MSRHPDSILGVTFKNNPNMVEHQWFPREYFSGSDVVIYFGDTFLSELNGLQFSIEEKVLPVYGYASYTWDEVARGSRYVTGSFRIPFVEAGYLETILTHIGTYSTEGEKVKPKMAYLLGNEKVPNWCADLKMDVEGLFNKYDPPKTDTGHKGTVSKSAAKIGSVIIPGTTSSIIPTVKAALYKKTKYVSPVSRFLIDRYGSDGADICSMAADEMIGYDNGTMEKLNRAVQETLNEIYKHDEKERFKDKAFFGSVGEDSVTRKLSELSIDGVIDSVSSDSLQLIKGWFLYKDKAHKEKSSLYDTSYKTTLDGDTIAMLAGSGDTQKYDPTMFVNVCQWQKANGYKATGELSGNQLSLLTADTTAIASVESRATAAGTSSYQSADGFSRYSERVNFYEHEVWGRDSSKDRDRKYQTYFYTDRWRYNGEDGQAILKKIGFDIYITYGPAADAQKYNTYHDPLGINAPALATYNFRTTVKSIRNVQLTSSGQTIMADGQPIAEEYTFIAQDLD